jgi:hypothetical protein
MLNLESKNVDEECEEPGAAVDRKFIIFNPHKAEPAGGPTPCCPTITFKDTHYPCSYSLVQHLASRTNGCFVPFLDKDHRRGSNNTVKMAIPWGT